MNTGGSTLFVSDKSYTSTNTGVEASKIVSRRRQYSDLDISLYLRETEQEQDVYDIVPLRDIDAVKNAVRILILSNHNDRPFQPYLGANLGGLLFEPADHFAEYAIRENIEYALKQHEPRVDNVEIQVKFEESGNRYRVDLSFKVISLSEDVDMTVYLTRVR